MHTINNAIIMTIDGMELLTDTNFATVKSFIKNYTLLRSNKCY